MKFIDASDIHLRFKKPRCRKDVDWMETQKNILNQVARASEEYDCPILIPGDIFNSSIVPEAVINMFLEFCKQTSQDILFIAGNHDLLEHSMEKLNDSSIGVLFKVRELGTSRLVPFEKYGKTFSYANFGEEIHNPGGEILVIHQLVFPEGFKLPIDNIVTAPDILKIYPEYKWIITGDCHIPYVYKNKGRYVINAGHLNIQKNNELDPPRMYFVDTDNEIVEEIMIEDDLELIDDEYIKKSEDREDRLEAFVELIETRSDVSLSFEDNIEMALLENKDVLEKETVKVVRELMKVEE